MNKFFLFMTTATLFSGCVAVVDDRPRHYHHEHERVIVEERPTVVEVR